MTQVLVTRAVVFLGSAKNLPFIAAFVGELLEASWAGSSLGDLACRKAEVAEAQMQAFAELSVDAQKALMRKAWKASLQGLLNAICQPDLPLAIEPLLDGFM